MLHSLLAVISSTVLLNNELFYPIVLSTISVSGATYFKQAFRLRKISPGLFDLSYLNYMSHSYHMQGT
jgi:hypothetical protein